MLRVFFVFFLPVVIYCQQLEKLLNIKIGIPEADLPHTRVTAPEWGTIIQRVDHFNPADNRTWSMRFLKGDSHFQEGGPIFIFIGGEWAISEGWLMSGIMYDMAEIHNGIMYYTEHRYYGQSYPTENISAENMKYLSADQALADLVYFIEYQKQNVVGLSNSPVVVVGASYAGTLATWGRLKYPHVIDIGYSSSGPLFAKADFVEYYQVVSENLRLSSPTCPTIIENAIIEINELLETSEGSSYISELFNVCEPVNGTIEPQRSYFFNAIVSPFASVTQYAQPGDLDLVCQYLESLTGSDLIKLATYVNAVYGSFCIASYDYFIQYYSSQELNYDEIYRQWLYQTCTEYGWYQTEAFGNSNKLQLYIQMCQDLFGEQYNALTLNMGIERTNLFYGGVEPELTRVISVHGTVDPWHPMGILNDLHDSAPAIVVNGTAHCDDLYSIRETDSEEMRQAKIKIMATIATWLAQINGEDVEETQTTVSGIQTSAPETVTPDDGSSDAMTFKISYILIITVLTLFIDF